LEPVYKPNSVSRHVGTVIIHLDSTSRSSSRDLPAPYNDASNISELLDLAPNGVYPASDVSIRTGGLLNHRFTFSPTRV